jgi:hypothetical protein
MISDKENADSGLTEQQDRVLRVAFLSGIECLVPAVLRPISPVRFAFKSGLSASANPVRQLYRYPPWSGWFGSDLFGQIGYTQEKKAS